MLAHVLNTARRLTEQYFKVVIGHGAELVREQLR